MLEERVTFNGFWRNLAKTFAKQFAFTATTKQERNEDGLLLQVVKVEKFKLIQDNFQFFKFIVLFFRSG